jgi:hypothetical protein
VYRTDWCIRAIVVFYCYQSLLLFLLFFFTMEKLTEPQRENVKRMSDIRLVSMLIRAGYTSERLEEMDRPAKMAAVAEIIASRKNGGVGQL